MEENSGQTTRIIERTITIGGFIVMLTITALGLVKTSNESAARDALLEHRVAAVEKEVGAHDFDVLEYKLDQLTLSVDELKELLKSLQ